MKWINGLTWEEKLRRLEQWHDWFSWFPVTVGTTLDGHKLKVWLETIEVSSKYHAYYDFAWYEHSYRLKSFESLPTPKKARK